jgi:hypothetical protein
MHWYDNIDTSNIKHRLTPLNGPYILLDKAELTNIDKLNNFNSAVLVRADIPHSIEAIEVPRISLSIRFMPKFNNKEINANYDWNHVINILKNDIESR